MLSIHWLDLFFGNLMVNMNKTGKSHNWLSWIWKFALSEENAHVCVILDNLPQVCYVKYRPCYVKYRPYGTMCPEERVSEVAFLCFSRSVLSDSSRPNGLQHARLPCPSPTPGACSDSCPSSRWCHPTISSSVVPFLTLSLSQHQGLFQWVSSSHQVAKVLELQLQSFQWIFRIDFL